ncbi:MAG TPA: prevent-host-death protein [Gammaproteobacteria bacterium]|nr:prevent-host-death protein [Gammaproteobacteria bacterium]
MSVHQWTLQDAKNKFSAVVNAAEQGNAQVVTRRGVPTAVVVSMDLFKRLQQFEQANTPTFIDHLLDIPQEDNVFEKIPFAARDIDFGETD